MATKAGQIEDERTEGGSDPDHYRAASGTRMQLREQVPCPYCKTSNTECVALFGPVLLTSQYYCKNCHSAFEVVKE